MIQYSRRLIHLTKGGLIIVSKHELQIDMKKTGAKIKALCKERNITVKDIQQELYISAFQSIYDWFSGKSLPSVDNLFGLSKILNVHMEDMIEVVSKPVIDFQQWQTRQQKLYLLTYYQRLSKIM